MAVSSPSPREDGGLLSCQAGVTQVVISAWTTSAPKRSTTLIGTTSSAPSSVMAPKSGGSISAVARSDVVALARYSTVIPFGIQRCVVGTVASISIPIAISAALQDAMACTVDKWLCTKNHLGTVTSANPGSIRNTCGNT